MHASGTGLDHGGHELVGVERAAEAGLRVGDDRREPVAARRPVLGRLDLVRPQEGVVDATHDGRDGVRRVEALVRVGLAGEVRVRRDLPSREVDGLQAGSHLLHGLVAGEGAESCDPAPVLAVHQVPETLGASPRERLLLDDAPPERDDVLGGEVAGDPAPAGLGLPGRLDRRGLRLRRLWRLVGRLVHGELLCSKNCGCVDPVPNQPPNQEILARNLPILLAHRRMRVARWPAWTSTF